MGEAADCMRQRLHAVRHGSCGMQELTPLPSSCGDPPRMRTPSPQPAHPAPLDAQTQTQQAARANALHESTKVGR